MFGLNWFRASGKDVFMSSAYCTLSLLFPNLEFPSPKDVLHKVCLTSSSEDENKNLKSSRTNGITDDG